MNEIFLALVDQQDVIHGHARADQCHSGTGLHHRAFVAVVYDEEDRLILQRRRHERFDGLWDFAAASHPRVTDSGLESYQDACDRALKWELGVAGLPVQKHGGFNYFQIDGDQCENEYCAIFVGRFSGDINANPGCLYESARMTLPVLLRRMQAAPGEYTPWALRAARMVPVNVSDLRLGG